MEMIEHLALGFRVAASIQNLLLCFVGVLVGTLIGVLPGIGPIATVAMLLPITFNMDPVGSLIMLAGIFYGAQYGGSTTAILVNIAGESSSVVTMLDGHQMAKQGKAGLALAIAAIGSFFAGTVATIFVAFFGPLLTQGAQAFGPPEYFALMMFGLIATIVLARGSVFKAILMIFVGLLLSLVGIDLETGAQRLTFGLPQLADGIEFVTLAMGLFGVAEIVRNLDGNEEPRTITQEVTGILPRLDDLRKALPAIIRGTGLGSLLGVLPGGGTVLASFTAYTVEKRIASDPERFGRGALEGVAAPEAANNAAAQTSFIPLLSLGVPPSAIMALMLGAMTIHGITPGPQVISNKPDLFWGMIASMWIGNLMLLVINLPLIGIWVRLLHVPYRLLFPGILTFCAIGVFAVNGSTLDIALLALFGCVGYALAKLDFEPAPLLIAFVIGRMLEEQLRRSLLMSRGDLSIFVQRPLCLALLILSVILLVAVVFPRVRTTRETAFQE